MALWANLAYPGLHGLWHRWRPVHIPASVIRIMTLKAVRAKLRPDDFHPLCPRYNPEDINLGRIQSDLEFLIERVSKLATRRGIGFATAPRHRRERGLASPGSSFSGAFAYSRARAKPYLYPLGAIMRGDANYRSP